VKRLATDKHTNVLFGVSEGKKKVQNFDRLKSLLIFLSLKVQTEACNEFGKVMNAIVALSIL
jgi:hypothetical protein